MGTVAIVAVKTCKEWRAGPMNAAAQNSVSDQGMENLATIQQPAISVNIDEAVAFLQCLFQPGDYLLLRPVESWIENGKNSQRPITSTLSIS